MTRKLLVFLLLASMIFAGYSIYYKVKYWGFNFTPKQSTDIWTIEAHIAFESNGEPIKITMSTPSKTSEYKILEEDLIAEGYKQYKTENKIILSSKGREGIQNLYYKVLLFDNQTGRGKTKVFTPKAPETPILEEAKLIIAQKIIKLAKTKSGDEVQQIIEMLNQTPIDATVLTFLPPKKTQKNMAESVMTLLSLKNIPSRIARGIKLVENKKSLSADLMLEAYIDGRWKVYDLQTAEIGIPENFVLFQRGGDSLIDVEGGENSSIKFSVLKSVNSSFKLAGARAKIANNKTLFDYSIYNLPVNEQNTLKWLSIFPLAILIVVLMRNVIGIQTMGTFTPMLLALSLIKTGLGAGLLIFAAIIGIGLLLRTILSKLNLLLVPRISAVVIFVILLMQLFTIIGYQFKIEIAQSAVFFPIIIMAWIIERASITWEEDGAKNAGKEILYSVLVAILTYFVVASDYIRHIMFAFNELNLVILSIVMLLGTYTGYRLTELTRFASLVKK